MPQSQEHGVGARGTGWSLFHNMGVPKKAKTERDYRRQKEKCGILDDVRNGGPYHVIMKKYGEEVRFDDYVTVDDSLVVTDPESVDTETEPAPQGDDSQEKVDECVLSPSKTDAMTALSTLVTHNTYDQLCHCMYRFPYVRFMSLLNV